MGLGFATNDSTTKLTLEKRGIFKLASIILWMYGYVQSTEIDSGDFCYFGFKKKKMKKK